MAKKTKDLETEEKKVASTKKSSTTKKVSKTKTTEKKAKTEAKKASTTKKSTTKKSTVAKKRTTTRTKSKATKIAPKVKKEFQNEYYDLPYSYNKTVVKVLAQTPKTLFVYWEISEQDRKNFIKKYGEHFFEQTKPILIVYNNTMQYSFEIEINDFANSWYIHINDSKCDYSLELGRRPLPFINYHTNQNYENHQYIPYYVYVASSNDIEVPNNRTLFDFYKTHKYVTFQNVKTGEIIYKEVSQFKFITNLGIMTIDELYKQLYPEEDFKYENFIGNPSSGLTSSGTFSSKFK